MKTKSKSAESASTGKAMFVVYLGYITRYVYLLILIPFYGRVLGADAYGKVLAAMSLFNLVWLVVNYGFSGVGVRTVASTADPREIGRQFGRHLAARSIMAVPGVGLGVAGTLGSPLLGSEPLYGIAATLLGLISGLNLGWYFQARRRFTTSIVLEVAGFAISLSIILTMVRGKNDGLLVLLALLVSAAVTSLAAYVLAIRQIGTRNLRFGGGRALVRESSPLFAAGGVPAAATNGSSLLLSLFSSPAQVGLFGAAERIASLGLSLLQPAHQVLVSTVAHRLGQREQTRQAVVLMRRAVTAMLCFGLTATAAAYLLAPSVLPWVLGEEFRSSVEILQVFSLIFPFAAFNQAIYMAVLIPLKRDKLVARAAVGGALVNVLAMLLLTPTHAGLGIATARVIGEVTSTLILCCAIAATGTLRHLRTAVAAGECS